MRLITELSYSDLKEWLSQIGKPSFHADQIFDWIYKKGATSFESMTNLSAELRNLLTYHFALSNLTFVKSTESSDQETIKYLWKLSDGRLVESVLISSGKRRTVCVSSQVGCPARCAFCASGQNGFFRNLRTGEIVDQVIQIDGELRKKGERVTNIVYMGMGEPLLNYENMVASIRCLTNPDGLGLSQRRITISTVGIIPGIERMTKEGLKVSLVLSLHAPNQYIRKKIIPYARKFDFDEILEAVEAYAAATKRNATYEYILIENINDHPDHAFELAKKLMGKQCTVNLIPYNPIPGVRLQRPRGQAIKNFRSVLCGCKIVNTCRYTKGVDIAAACGQLALQES